MLQTKQQKENDNLKNTLNEEPMKMAVERIKHEKQTVSVNQLLVENVQFLTSLKHTG